MTDKNKNKNKNKDESRTFTIGWDDVVSHLCDEVRRNRGDYISAVRGAARDLCGEAAAGLKVSVDRRPVAVTCTGDGLGFAVCAEPEDGLVRLNLSSCLVYQVSQVLTMVLDNYLKHERDARKRVTRDLTRAGRALKHV